MYYYSIFHTWRQAVIIGISGPAATGKTTLLDDCRPLLSILAESLDMELEIRTERIRHLFQEQYASKWASLDQLLAKEPLELNMRLARLFHQEALEDAASKRSKLIIYDRTALDVTAYSTIDIARGFRNRLLEEDIDNDWHSNAADQSNIHDIAT